MAIYKRRRLLVGLLHSRICLFGEILQLLYEAPGLTHKELREKAATKYHLEWKTLDPIRKRVGWLRSLGLVAFSFDEKLSREEVIDCLRREFDNPDGETDGTLTAEQIYFLLRDAVEPRPTQAAIKPLLELLASPLIQGTRASGKGWALPDPPTQIARRLHTIANQVEALEEPEKQT